MLGRSYSCNPKAIYEEMVQRGMDETYEIYWIQDKASSFTVPGKAKIIRRNSFTHLRLLCQARYWIFNTRVAAWFVKGEGTTYLMTWHGTPLKKLALDLEEVHMAGSSNIETYHRNFYTQSRRWDALIAPNAYSEEIFKRCFAFDKKMYCTGYPRNDVLVKYGNDADYINCLKEQYQLPSDKKIILYAPTWRDDESIGKQKYIFNPQIDFDMLYEELREEYVFIVKYHYLIASKLDFTKYEGFIYTIDTDINDLYLVSDMHMTDYSSTMFDYSILRRPLLFYTYDLESYYKKRGVYFDLTKEAPGPFFFETKELVDFLKHPDFTPYQEKYDAFAQKFTSWERGCAAAEIVDDLFA
jgi:CDP-glycerol glycerophosphotransferase